ncbi:MAG: hypothetical protein JWO03_1533 [Bacteroidetes bacterium]|nr:hypothetical protein [Bacteroidota bacterium]
MNVKYFILVFLFIVTGSVHAQTFTINGKVSAAGTAQDDALIDVYEYNSPIQTLHTDAKGNFSTEIIKGKEYIIIVYKSGYVLQSFSISDNKQSKTKTYTLSVDLDADPKSPQGLYFKEPLKRISPEIDLQGLWERKFELVQVKPQHRADSVLVLLNRAQANQYILVSKMKINTMSADEKYSRQIEENIQSEIRSYSTQIIQSNAHYDALKQEEDSHVAASLKTKDDEQYGHLVNAQKDLAERLAERANYFLLLQQKQLAKARLLELSVIKDDQMLNVTTDSVRRQELKKDVWKLKAGATNARYQAMDANARFLSYNKFQMLNYQEYIEMMRMKGEKKDTARTAVAPARKPSTPEHATITPPDTSDNLAKLDNDKREKVIQEALEEEERFKNYESKTEKKKINGVELTVQDIRISGDNYEMQVDKKGEAHYYKNGKPVTRLTFEFETRRRMVDVLNTIREVDKFGR